MLVPTNAGNPALCLSLSQPSEVAPGSATCGPFGEDAAVHLGIGQGLSGNARGPGTRTYGSTTAQKTIGNSNYNALEANLRLTPGKRATLLRRLHLFEVDRRRVKSRRTDQSVQRKPDARDLLLGHDA